MVTVIDHILLEVTTVLTYPLCTDLILTYLNLFFNLILHLPGVKRFLSTEEEEEGSQTPFKPRLLNSECFWN